MDHAAQRWMLELPWAALGWKCGARAKPVARDERRRFHDYGQADYGCRTVWSGDRAASDLFQARQSRAMAPRRVAHLLGLGGPAMFVDTTCSSSLVAIHLAARGLREGDCRSPIAGGVNLILGPEETVGVRAAESDCRRRANAALSTRTPMATYVAKAAVSSS